MRVAAMATVMMAIAELQTCPLIPGVGLKDPPMDHPQVIMLDGLANREPYSFNFLFFGTVSHRIGKFHQLSIELHAVKLHSISGIYTVIFLIL